MPQPAMPAFIDFELGTVLVKRHGSRSAGLLLSVKRQLFGARQEFRLLTGHRMPGRSHGRSLRARNDFGVNLFTLVRVNKEERYQ